MSSCVNCSKQLHNGICGDKAYTCQSPECQKCLCSSCYAQHPLFVAADDPNDLNRGDVQRLCQPCFQSKSTVDFNVTYDYKPSSSGTTFVLVHGASACREMFRPHAEALLSTAGHGYVLLDLPGHATLVDVPLTLDTCVATIRETVTKCDLGANEKLIYVGGSLGAYVGFYVLQELKDLFKGAVLMDCGQNVGPGCGIAAKVGLVFLSMLGRNSSNYSMMNLMLSVSKKSKADYHLVDSVFGAGIWFDQAGEHVDCLKAVAPAELIPNILVPILYMNGSEDHRDSEQKWVELSKERSSLKVYESGDHFFTHDSRFVDDIIETILEFEKLL